jgi:hypothetical protein
VPRFLAKLFDQFVQSERGSQLRIDLDRPLALDLAICLREANPAWAKTRAQDAFEYWESQLEQEPATEDVLSRAAGMLMDTFTTLLRGFRNHRELDLWEMTQTLVRWGLQGDAPAEVLTQLQTAIERVGDIHLRYLLLAPVTCGWLQVQDFGRVHRLLERLDMSHLERAGFHEKLLSLTYSETLNRPLLQDLRNLCLEVLLATPTTTEAFIEVLTAWLDLRVAGMSEQRVKVQFVEAMLEFHQRLGERLTQE